MGQYRILIVEDNPMNLELAVDLLEASGFAVMTAQTAEAGVRLAQQQPPDLVLMDLSLPGMDGLQATKALKSHPATRDVWVIALTAHAMKGDKEIALNANCDGYLTKPIDTRSFVATITEFIGASSTEKKKAA